MVVADAPLAGLFQGLDFDRVDEKAGSSTSLIEEIWRLFLAIMMLALILEAALCIPRAAAAGDDHRRLPGCDQEASRRLNATSELDVSRHAADRRRCRSSPSC